MDDFNDFFSPNDTYLFVHDTRGPHFLIPQGKLLWQPIMGEICKMTFIWQAGSLFVLQLPSSQLCDEEAEINPCSDDSDEDDANKKASSTDSQSSKKIKQLKKKPEMTDLLKQMITENRRTEREAQKKVAFLNLMRCELH